MSLVDPFIPVNKPNSAPLPRKPKPDLVNNVAPYIVRRPPKPTTEAHRVPIHRAPQPKPPVRMPATRPRQPEAHYPAPKPTVAQRPIITIKTAPKTKRKKLHRTLSILHLVGGTAAIMGLGLFMPSLIIGEICVGLYALVVCIVRVPSNAIFSLAALSFIGILVAQQLQDYSPVANVAIYTFMLLAVGALSLIRETVRRNKVEA
jgi:hypothetical protein